MPQRSGPVPEPPGTKDDGETKRDPMAVLSESAERYRHLLDLSPDPMVLHDGNVILIANRAAADMVGFDDADLAGQPVMAFVHPDSRAAVAERVRAMLDEGRAVPPLDEKLVRRDGATIETRSIAAAVLFRGRRAVHEVMRDVREVEEARAEARRSEERFRDLFDSSPVPLLVQDFSAAKVCVDALRRQGIGDLHGYLNAHPDELARCMAGIRTLDANDAALRLHRVRSADELIALLDEPTDEPTSETLPIAAGALVAMSRGEREHEAEGPSYRANGQQLDVLVRWRVAAGHETDYARVLVFILDITARKRMEDALRESEDLFRSVVESAPFGLHFYKLDGAERLVFVGSNPAADAILGVDNSVFVGKTFEQAFPALAGTQVPDHYRRLAEEGGIWRSERVDYEQDGVSGAFEVSAFGVSPGEMAVAFRDVTQRIRTEEELARYRDHLEQLVAERTRELTAVHQELDAVATVVSRTVEARDPYTAGHQRRVAALAKAIAERMGFDEDAVESTWVAAKIHDIGKVSVPAEILSKPTRLTRIEYELVKEHSQVAYEILQAVRLRWPIAELVLQHHERLDGSGYPQGLKAEEILPGARVIAVADVVEAMSSHRPYRPAHGLKAALDEVKAGSGTAFDREAVDACVALFTGGFTLETDEG